jgi:hypothetical protein
MPRRISVTPPAIQTFTPAENAIMAGPPQPAPGQAFRLHTRRNDEPMPIRQDYLNLTSRRRTGTERTALRRGRALRDTYRRKRHRVRRAKLTVAILPPPSGQKRAGNTIPPSCRCQPAGGP